MTNYKIRTGPSGIHLFNRNTGINILFDELVPPRKIWSKAPRQVSIALTNICDLRCSYCFAPKNKASLEFNQLIKWIKELDSNGCIGIGFGGGEPTLYKRLPELCQYISENTSLAITMTTHAHRLTERLARQLKGYINFIRVSMDGIRKTYESIRNKSFDSFIKKIELAKIMAPIGINYVVNSYTISELDEATALAHDIGAVEFLLLPEVPSKGTLGIDLNTVNSLRNWILGYKGKIRLSINEIGSAGLPICNPLEPEKGLLSYAHIDAKGVLKRTSFDTNGVNIGNNSIMKSISLLKSKSRR